MSTLLDFSPPVSTSRRLRSLGLPSRAFMLRAALLAGAFAASLAAFALASPAGVKEVEPTLVVLLRGMALIKGGAVLVAVALALWRFGRPVSTRAAVGYSLGVAGLVAATVLIWYLSFLVVAAVLFHTALLGLGVLAWREGSSGWRAGAA